MTFFLFLVEFGDNLHVCYKNYRNRQAVCDTHKCVRNRYVATVCKVFQEES